MKKVNAQVTKPFVRVLDHVIAVLFGIIMVLTVFQVLSRFVFFLPAPWVEELISYLFVWMIFFGAAVAQYSREHTQVELLPLVLKGRPLTLLLTVSDILVMVFLLVVVVFGVELVRFTLPMDSQVLKFPMGVFYLSAPVGSLFMLIFTVRAVMVRLSQRR